MKRSTALLAAIVGLGAPGTSPAPAAAAGTIAPIPAFTPTPFAMGGPVLAGNRIAWAAPSGAGGYDVTTQESDGSGVVTQHVSTPDVPPNSGGRLYLEASGQRVGLGLHVDRCEASECDTLTGVTRYQSRLSAPLGQPLEQVGSGCTSTAECDRNRCLSEPLVDVWEQVVAYSSCSARLVVHDFAPGASPSEREFADANQGRIAGSKVAVQLPDQSSASGGAHVAVRDWRTGAELYRLGGYAPFDVQADGKVTFIRRVPESVFPRFAIDWASPEEPLPHTVGTVALEAPAELRIADNRIAYMTIPNGGVAPTIEVRALDGTEVAVIPAPGGLSRLDFDGSRVTWAERPCRVVSILTWDLHGLAPSVSHRCPPAKVATGHARVNGQRSLPLQLSCRSDPTLGCAGTVTVTARAAGRHHPRLAVAEHFYALDPARHEVLRLPLGKRILCADRHERVLARVTSTSQADVPRGASGSDTSHALRLRGPGLRTAPCP
ncbi:MAG: hypothetical protein QOK25_2378 [Thermoleophilaceae bacterium]|nr:hypothetical protein [Thermoleophilaceae bacterium]